MGEAPSSSTATMALLKGRSGALLNIPSYKDDDPRYRYTMPALVCRAEGSGNGKKTRILNLGEVGQALKRPAEYLMKFFGYELGSRSSYTEKKKGKTEEQAFLDGWWEVSTLQELLDKFIEKYVLCPQCRLPEIDVVVKEKRAQDLKATCKACGWRGHLDTEHKIGSYILKNPPPPEEAFAAGGDVAVAVDSSSGKQKGKTFSAREARQQARALRQSQQQKVAVEAPAEAEEEGATGEEGDGGEDTTSSSRKKDAGKENYSPEKAIMEKQNKKNSETAVRRRVRERRTSLEALPPRRTKEVLPPRRT